MSVGTSGPIPYRVSYSEPVRRRLLALTDVARQRGDAEEFLPALKDFYRRQ